MSQWKCFNCKVEMEEVDDIKLSFNDMNLPDADGLRCPACGMEILEAEYVTDQLIPAEQMLSGK